ncbi:hypothetical protein [Maricaulis sp.]|uniref:hypothetical protein n=1 Tax=Maricaulis sp. TaxID=1486257 RepID=UPI0026222D3C|nr:hypothetical protein [Maricaulis sp.]
MPPIALWFARLVAPLCMTIHAAGIILWGIHGGGPDSAGVQLMVFSWVVVLAYSCIRWLQGDYIQRALNLKPWIKQTDAAVLEQARIAATRTAFSLLVLIGMLIGVTIEGLVLGDELAPEDALKTARFMFVSLSFIGLTGAALPTALMAWSIPPLGEDEDDHGN